MKTNYDGVKGWINYIRDYKYNKDNDLISENRLIEANKKIQELEKHIDNTALLTKQKEELIQLGDIRIKQLNGKVSRLKSYNKKILEDLANERAANIDLEAKLAEKEHTRRVTQGTTCSLKAKISRLEKTLQKANYTIEFYKTHQKSPTIEELKAYDFQFKEVEKRQKNEK